MGARGQDRLIESSGSLKDVGMGFAIPKRKEVKRGSNAAIIDRESRFYEF